MTGTTTRSRTWTYLLLAATLALALAAARANAVTDLAAHVAWNGLAATTGTGQVLSPNVLDTHAFARLCPGTSSCQWIDMANTPLPMTAEVSDATSRVRATLSGLAGGALDTTSQAVDSPIFQADAYSVLLAFVLIEANDSVTITLPVALTLTQAGIPGAGLYSTGTVSLVARPDFSAPLRDVVEATSIAGPASVIDTLTVTYTNDGRLRKSVELRIEATLQSLPLMVPEPHAWALLGAGLLLLGGRTRRATRLNAPAGFP